MSDSSIRLWLYQIQKQNMSGINYKANLHMVFEVKQKNHIPAQIKMALCVKTKVT